MRQSFVMSAAFATFVVCVSPIECYRDLFFSSTVGFSLHLTVASIILDLSFIIMLCVFSAGSIILLS